MKNPNIIYIGGIRTELPNDRYIYVIAAGVLTTLDMIINVNA